MAEPRTPIAPGGATVKARARRPGTTAGRANPYDRPDRPPGQSNGPAGAAVVGWSCAAFEPVAESREHRLQQLVGSALLGDERVEALIHLALALLGLLHDASVMNPHVATSVRPRVRPTDRLASSRAAR